MPGQTRQKRARIAAAMGWSERRRTAGPVTSGHGDQAEVRAVGQFCDEGALACDSLETEASTSGFPDGMRRNTPPRRSAEGLIPDGTDMKRPVKGRSVGSVTP